MQPPVHAAVSTVGGLIIWSLTGESLAVSVSLASGVLIDVDYLLYKSKLVPKIFHAWEWLLGLVSLVILMDFPWWGLAAIAGYGLHIVCDQLNHRRGHLWYFITFRICVLFTRTRKMPAEMAITPGARPVIVCVTNRTIAIVRKKRPFFIRL